MWVDIDAVLKKMDDLRVIKSVALKIFNMANDPMTTAEDITTVLKEDDYLSVLVLKVANSSYFGSSGKVKTINEAVVLLGYTCLKSIVLAASLRVKNDDYSVSKSEIITREILWRHSISTAVSAKYLAEKTGLVDSEQAYIAGIVHDIGRLSIYKYDEKLYSMVENSARDYQMKIEDAERKFLGFDHAQVGGIVLGKWNFPESIFKSTLYHHNYFDDMEHRELIAVVSLANFISNSLGFGMVNTPEINEKVLSRLGMHFETLKNHIEEISLILSHIEILSMGM